MLAGIQDSSNESRQISSLHELNMVLSMGSGHVRVGEVTPVLVKLISSTSSLEMVLLACRALNTIIDINPRACDLILPAVPTLCERLLKLDDLDVAEQCMKCLSLLASEHPRYILDAGGLAASTLFFEFFPQHIQRMALSTCLHLCEVVNTKADVARLMPILPCLSKCLASEDQTVVNRACQCFGRVIEGLASGAPRRHATSSTPLAPSELRDRKPPLPPKSTEDDSVIWKAGVAKEMAESGLLQQWLLMISVNSPDNHNALKTQTLASITSLLGMAPAILPLLLEHNILELLQRFLVDYVEGNSSMTSSSFIIAVLQLAKALLPSPDAVLKKGALHKAPQRTSTKKGSGGRDPAAGSSSMKSSSDAMSKSPAAPSVSNATASPSTQPTANALPAPQPSPLSDSKPLASPASPSTDQSARLSGEWSCPACTFINSNLAMIACEICGTLNPIRSPALSSSSPMLMGASGLKLGLSDFELGSASAMMDVTPMEFTAETVGPLSLLEVYAEQPEYYDSYAKALLFPLLQLALQTSTRSIGQLVFAILTSLRCHHMATFADPAVASDVAAVLFQTLVHGDAERIVQAVDFGSSLVGSLPDLYIEQSLRHGLIKQVMLINEAYIAKGRLGKQGGVSSKRASGAKDMETDGVAKVLAALRRFFPVVQERLGISGKAEAATSAGKKRRRPIEEELMEAAQATSNLDLDSKRLKALRRIADFLRSPLQEKRESPSKRQKDGHGDPHRPNPEGEMMVQLKALAQLLTSPEGVTMFELRESGIIEALGAFMYSTVVYNPTDAGNSADASKLQNARYAKLQAFASTFTHFTVKGQADSTALIVLAQLLQATLSSLDTLPSVKHGGDAVSTRYKNLVRPFRFRFRESQALLESAKLGGGASSAPSSASSTSLRRMAGFLVEPLTLVGQLRRYIEQQAQANVQRARTEADRRKNEATKQALGQQADAQSSSSSKAQVASMASSVPPASAASAPPPKAKADLDVNTAMAMDIDQGSGPRKLVLRRSPRVEQAHKQEKPGNSPSVSVSGGEAGSSGGAASVASRTRSHDKRGRGSRRDRTVGRSSGGSSHHKPGRGAQQLIPSDSANSEEGRIKRKSPRGVASSSAGAHDDTTMAGAAVKRSSPPSSEAASSRSGLSSSLKPSAGGKSGGSYKLRSRKVGEGEITADFKDSTEGGGGAAQPPPLDVRQLSSSSAAGSGTAAKRVPTTFPALARNSLIYSAFNVNGRRVYYRGRVLSCGKETADILYEDGERRKTMPRALIHDTPPHGAVSYPEYRRQIGRPVGALSQSFGLDSDEDEAWGGRSLMDVLTRKASRPGSGSSSGLPGSAPDGGLMSALEDLEGVEPDDSCLLYLGDNAEELPSSMGAAKAAACRTVSGLSSTSSSDQPCGVLGMLRRESSGGRSVGGGDSGGGPSSSRDHEVEKEALRQLMEQAPREPGSSAEAGEKIASSSLSAVLAAKQQQYRRYAGMYSTPTLILRRRFDDLDVGNVQEHIGLILQQLGGGTHLGAQPGERVAVDAYTVDFAPLRLNDEPLISLDRRERNHQAVLGCLSVYKGPMEDLKPQAATSSSGVSTSSPKITSIRLTLDGVSADLGKLPENMTAFEVVQILVWARKQMQAGLGLPTTSAKLAYREMSVDERAWGETLLIDYQVQTGDAASSSVNGSIRKKAKKSNEPQESVSGAASSIAGGDPMELGDEDASSSNNKSGHGVPVVLTDGQTSFDASLLLRLEDTEPKASCMGGELSSVQATLRLLRYLLLFSRFMERSQRTMEPDLPPSLLMKEVDWSKLAEFCMVKSLARKLLGQLQDPMAVASESWPDWCDKVVAGYAELLSLDVRLQYFQATSFSPARAIHHLQEQAQRLQTSIAGDASAPAPAAFSASSHRVTNLVDYVTRFGRLRRRRVVLPRENILESAVEAFEKIAEVDGVPHEAEGEEGEEEHEEESVDGDEEEHVELAPTGGGAASSRGVTSPLSRVVKRSTAMASEDEDDDEENGGDDEDGADDQGEEEDEEGDQEGQGSHEYQHQQGAFRDGLLVVDFKGETGHGTGPTQEFYSLVCRELQRKGLGLWRGDQLGTDTTAMDVDREDGKEKADGDLYIDGQCGGLFPAVFAVPDKQHTGSKEGEHTKDGDERKSKTLRYFRFLGRFIGKALQDNRLLDLPLSLPLCKTLLGSPLTLADVSLVDEGLGRSIKEIHQMAHDTQEDVEKKSRLAQYLEGLQLDFTLPGADWYELKEGGAKMVVTPDNVHEYVRLITEHLLVKSVAPHVEALKAGIEDVFPLAALRCFGPEELQQSLCGGHSEDWGEETIESSIVCKHGYSRSSPHIHQLVRVMAAFTLEERKQFLMFITGTPRLPIGGFAALKPNLTVVRKDVGAGFAVDEYLPSCSTCQVYLKLPPYSTEEVMRVKLLQAMTMGKDYFSMD